MVKFDKEWYKIASYITWNENRYTNSSQWWKIARFYKLQNEKTSIKIQLHIVKYKFLSIEKCRAIIAIAVAYFSRKKRNK